MNFHDLISLSDGYNNNFIEELHTSNSLFMIYLVKENLEWMDRVTDG